MTLPKSCIPADTDCNSSTGAIPGVAISGRSGNYVRCGSRIKNNWTWFAQPTKCGNTADPEKLLFRFSGGCPCW